MDTNNITCWEDILYGEPLSENKKPSYGGAYDIADDQYFTKEDLLEFVYALMDEIEDVTDVKLDIDDIQLDNNKLVITLLDVNNQNSFENQITIDMRKIKLPRDLLKYLQPLKDAFVKDITSMNESFVAEDSIKLTRDQIADLNKICQKYCGWKFPRQISLLWDELEAAGVGPILISGYPNHTAADGGKSWELNYTFNDKDVVNSQFIYQVYEGSDDSLKNEYNIYFS